MVLNHKAIHIYILGIFSEVPTHLHLLFFFFKRLLIGPKAIISLVISNTFSLTFRFPFYLRKCLTTETMRRRTVLQLTYVLHFSEYLATDSS